jgi:hypothetical protein
VHGFHLQEIRSRFLASLSGGQCSFGWFFGDCDTPNPPSVNALGPAQERGENTF